MGHEPPSISWMNGIDRADWSEMIVVGRIARAHGRRGAVIVNPDTDFPDQRFRRGAIVYASVGGEPLALRIIDVRFVSKRPILALESIETIAQAQALAGCALRIPLSEQQPLPADVYYEHVLIGCEVKTVEDISIGTVIAVQGVPGVNRLIVRGRESGDEIDIPLAESICVRVDPEHGVVVVDPPAGLLELNRRGD